MHNIDLLIIFPTKLYQLSDFLRSWCFWSIKSLRIGCMRNISLRKIKNVKDYFATESYWETRF